MNEIIKRSDNDDDKKKKEKPPIPSWLQEEAVIRKRLEIGQILINTIRREYPSTYINNPENLIAEIKDIADRAAGYVDHHYGRAVWDEETPGEDTEEE